MFIFLGLIILLPLTGLVINADEPPAKPEVVKEMLQDEKQGDMK